MSNRPAIKIHNCPAWLQSSHRPKSLSDNVDCWPFESQPRIENYPIIYVFRCVRVGLHVCVCMCVCMRLLLVCDGVWFIEMNGAGESGFFSSRHLRF